MHARPDGNAYLAPDRGPDGGPDPAADGAPASDRAGYFTVKTSHLVAAAVCAALAGMVACRR